MATRFDWGGESTPQRNERAKESASDFEASPDALDRFFSDAVRAFPSPSRPATEERPSHRALPRTSGSSAETASVRDESLEAPGHPLLRAEEASARLGTAIVEEPSQTAAERPPSERAPREPRQKPPAPVSRRRRVGWGEIAPRLDEVGAVAFGVAFPAVFFVLSAVGVIERDAAFVLAEWTGVGLITFYGVCAGRLAGRGWLPSLVHGVAAGAVAVALIVLKALLH